MATPLGAEEKIDAVKAWAQVFRSTDPFGWPFSDAVESGRVIYPTDGCHRSAEQFSALASAAGEVDEACCYVAVLEGRDRLVGAEAEKIFLIDLSSYESYSSLHLTLENAIYSVNGRWGVLVSHEMHGVLGSDTSFVSRFNRLDGAAGEQWDEFAAEWSSEKHRDWLGDIASHIKLA